MLKLVIYKKKACIYLVGGTGKPICTLPKNSTYTYILGRLSFILSSKFWDTYSGMYNKGKLYKVNTKEETADIIEKLIKEN
jgi:hypothetical protein